MTRADDILQQIDSTLDDWTVSGDAMRSQPAVDPAGFQGVTPSVFVADEAGEWQELGHATGLVFHTELPAPDEAFMRAWQELQEQIRRVQIERARRAREILDVLARTLYESVKPAVEEAGRNIARSLDSLKQAGVIDADCKPVRPRDRPAWQSPYGPARRRR
ncbi:hypothetical protein B0675_40040 [Streptomyces sp. M41(2017)]|uniref:hypothetical protein n=1 Tax=Streptomyces sp. M41(2017) TaxID=1955065 RepID=UPI0009C136B2|nr:hypothetical protein [Streptomyces sp. M41(2017)]OQQ13011.1 hypothetical protein B0675_40040 [Streptomyces sp. M41(2017)]